MGGYIDGSALIGVTFISMNRSKDRVGIKLDTPVLLAGNAQSSCLRPFLIKNSTELVAFRHLLFFFKEIL